MGFTVGSIIFYDSLAIRLIAPIIIYVMLPLAGLASLLHVMAWTLSDAHAVEASIASYTEYRDHYVQADTQLQAITDETLKLSLSNKDKITLQHPVSLQPVHDCVIPEVSPSKAREFHDRVALLQKLRGEPAQLEIKPHQSVSGLASYGSVLHCDDTTVKLDNVMLLRTNFQRAYLNCLAILLLMAMIASIFIVI